MPLRDDDYVPSTEDELYQELATILQEETDGEAEDFEGSVIQALMRADAKMTAKYQEQSLDKLYDASYLATATGEQLDLKVDEIGISRKEATPATGVQQFLRDSKALTEYIVAKGTTVRTANGEVSFETTEGGSIKPLALFNSSSLDTAWNGDLSSFTNVTSPVEQGSHAVEVGATNGVEMWRTDVTVANGDIFESSVNLSSNNVVGVRFGVEDSSNYYEVRIDGSGSVTVYDVDGGTENQLGTTSAAVPTDSYFTIEVDIDMTDEISVTLIDGETTIERLDVTTTYTKGGIGIASYDANSVKHVDTITRTATTLNIEATTGGEVTNVGADRLIDMPSPPTGVTDTTNTLPTGNPDYRDTNEEKLVIGTNRETDEELRERAIESGSRGGAGTAKAVEAAIADLDDVIHVEAIENKELSTVNGLPPLSIEFIIYGGQDADIAKTLHENVGLTERLASGVNGTAVTYDYYNDLLNEDETYEWSTPTNVTVDVTLDIVVDDSYEGDNAVKSTIVDYIGGTDVDGGFVTGTDIGEDIYHDAIIDMVRGDELGVVGISNISLDQDGDGNDDTTTNANGLKVLQIPTTKIASTDGTDGSITINTTEV